MVENCNNMCVIKPNQQKSLTRYCKKKTKSLQIHSTILNHNTASLCILKRNIYTVFEINKRENTLINVSVYLSSWNLDFFLAMTSSLLGFGFFAMFFGITSSFSFFSSLPVATFSNSLYISWIKECFYALHF